MDVAQPAAEGARGRIGARRHLDARIQRQLLVDVVLEDRLVLPEDVLLEGHDLAARAFGIEQADREVRDAALFVGGLDEQEDDVGELGRTARRMLVEHRRERIDDTVDVVDVRPALRIRRGQRLDELAVARPELLVGVELDLVAAHLGRFFRSEDVGMDEGKVRHVEEVLHHPQRTAVDTEAAHVEEASRGVREGRQYEKRLGLVAEAQQDEAAVVGGVARPRGFGIEPGLERAVGLAAHVQVVAQQSGSPARAGREAEAVADGKPVGRDRGVDDVRHVRSPSGHGPRPSIGRCAS